MSSLLYVMKWLQFCTGLCCCQVVAAPFFPRYRTITTTVFFRTNKISKLIPSHGAPPPAPGKPSACFVCCGRQPRVSAMSHAERRLPYGREQHSTRRNLAGCGGGQPAGSRSGRPWPATNASLPPSPPGAFAAMSVPSKRHLGAQHDMSEAVSSGPGTSRASRRAVVAPTRPRS